ncbi:MAG: mechanosensitive ion channel [candidate division NC10 bacterium]|nr:mechanosensitive ion channel [candidate division NC10 bacterium]
MPSQGFEEVVKVLRTSGLKVAVIALGSLLLIRLLRIIADKVVKFVEREKAPFGNELEKRAKTLAGIVKTVGTAIILVIAIMMALKELGLDITPIIAGAGMAGLAIGFGAQSLIEDINRVVELLNRVGKELQEDGTFGKILLEAPQVLGVEAFGESEMRIRMVAKTLPQKQWEVARELRKRIKVAFDREGIEIPPHQGMSLKVKDLSPPEVKA